LRGSDERVVLANCITSDEAVPLIERLNRELRKEFTEFELHYNSDFRNTLVMRQARIDPELLRCPEPHENHGMVFKFGRLISGKDARSAVVAARLNEYLGRPAQLLVDASASMLFLWSASKPLRLPPFADVTGFSDRVGAVGCMDFLEGIAKTGGIDFFKVGNRRSSTDYRAKGEKVIELFGAAYRCIVCHVKVPDEAAHMRDLPLKVRCFALLDDPEAGG